MRTHSFRSLSRLVLALALVSAAIPFTFGQGIGRITGTVTDQTGAAIGNARITATQAATGVKTTVVSSGSGTYVFPSLPPAAYTIEASAPGFSNFVQRNVVLQVNQAVTVNVVLQVGSASQTVSVSGAPPQVDLTTGTVSQVVPGKSINDLPLNGRNAAALTTLVAGVVVAPNAQADQGSTKTFPVVVTISANGTFANQTNFLLDGGNNIDEYTNVNAPFPFPDALQEFSVQTTNYNAQYGQNAGGVVNIITKSGTSKYHGDLFEYVRNRVFNAANYFSYANGKKVVDPLKRNQFGGTVGGPVSIPHLFQTHKSFFFGGYQRTTTRDVASATTSSILPTTAQLNGTYVQSNCVLNPFPNGTPFPCTANGDGTFTTQIDPSTYNASSLALLKYLPAGGATGSFTYRKPTVQNFNEGIGRFDQTIGQNDHLTARYYINQFQNQGVLDLKDLLTYSDQSEIDYHNALISETHAFSPRVLNNLTASYQYEISTRGPLSGGISVNDLGVNIWQPAFKQINQILVGGLVNSTPTGFTIGDNPAASFRRANYTFSDDLHYTAGSHDLGFGAHVEISKIDVANLFQQPGLFSFTATGTNNPEASFLLGYLNQFVQGSGQYFNNRGKFLGFYAQDTWKATRRLTLDYGVRWEPYIPWHEKEHRMGGFSPTNFAAGRRSAVFPNAPVGLVFAGDQGFQPNGMTSDYSHVMPRVGFAYDLFGNGKTAVRGGFGMFYESRPSGVFNNIFSNGSPFVTTFNVTYPTNAPGNFSDPYAGFTNPFPAPQPPLSSSPIPPQPYMSFDPYNGFHVPVNFGWNLSVEHQWATSLTSRIAYVGSHGSHEWEPTDINSKYISGPNAGQRVFQFTPSGQPSGLSQQLALVNMGGNSSYNSLQFSLTKRLRNGLSFLANYTWSKTLTDLPWNASATAVVTGQSYVLPTYMPDYKRLDYGPSEFDHRNVIAISYTWELPAVTSGPAALRYIGSHWETGGIYSFRSGDPLTILSGQDNSGTGEGRDRAVYRGSGAYGGNACGAVSPCKNFLNPAAFTANPQGTFGNAQKGEFAGPQYSDWDVNLMRYFPITERAQFQFRAEFFNVFNHTNFSDPANTLGSSFGRISGASDPRIGQLSLKLLF